MWYLLSNYWYTVELISQSKVSISLVRGLFKGTWRGDSCTVYSRVRCKGVNQSRKYGTYITDNFLRAGQVALNDPLYLFDGDGHSDGVDGAFYLHLLLLIATNHHWRHQ